MRFVFFSWFEIYGYIGKEGKMPSDCGVVCTHESVVITCNTQSNPDHLEYIIISESL